MKLFDALIYKVGIHAAAIEDKLLAAPSDRAKTFLVEFKDTFGKRDQYLIADIVAETVVDLLEKEKSILYHDKQEILCKAGSGQPAFPSGRCAKKNTPLVHNSLTHHLYRPANFRHFSQ